MRLHHHVHKKRWRTKRGKRRYLFSHKALAKVVGAKLLEAIAAAGLILPSALPSTWVVDCKNVGHGEKALEIRGQARMALT